MIVEYILSLIGIGLTLPQIVAISSNFNTNSYVTWVQFLPQLFLLTALSIKPFKKQRLPCLIISSLSLLGIYFLLIFNSQDSSYVICSTFSTICAELNDIVCSGNVLAAWEALLYLFGLCICVIGTTLLIKTTHKDYNDSKAAVQPVSSP